MQALQDVELIKITNTQEDASHTVDDKDAQFYAMIDEALKSPVTEMSFDELMEMHRKVKTPQESQLTKEEHEKAFYTKVDRARKQTPVKMTYEELQAFVREL